MMRILYCALGLLLASLALGCNRSSPTPDPTPIADAPGSLTSPAPDSSEDTQSGPKPLSQVPQLVGVPSDWAMQLLRLKQLRGVNGRLYLPADQWQSEWAEARVYLQTPQSSTAIRPDAHVAFWTVHRAAEDDALVEVPTVIGKRVDDATTELEAAGFTVMTVHRQPTKKENQAPEAVLDQYPRTPQVLGPSSTVLLHVASSSVQD